MCRSRAPSVIFTQVQKHAERLTHSRAFSERPTSDEEKTINENLRRDDDLRERIHAMGTFGPPRENERDVTSIAETLTGDLFFPSRRNESCDKQKYCCLEMQRKKNDLCPRKLTEMGDPTKIRQQKNFSHQFLADWVKIRRSHFLLGWYVDHLAAPSRLCLRNVFGLNFGKIFPSRSASVTLRQKGSAGVKAQQGTGLEARKFSTGCFEAKLTETRKSRN